MEIFDDFDVCSASTLRRIVKGTCDDVQHSYRLRAGKISGGDMRAMRTWDRRIKSVARTIMIAKPHVIGTQEGLGTQLDELENYLSDEYKQYKGLGRLGGVRTTTTTSSCRCFTILIF